MTPLGPPGRPPYPSQTSGWASRMFGKTFRPIPDLLESFPTTLGTPDGPPDPYRTFGLASRTSRRATRLLPDL